VIKERGVCLIQAVHCRNLLLEDHQCCDWSTPNSSSSDLPFPVPFNSEKSGSNLFPAGGVWVAIDFGVEVARFPITICDGFGEGSSSFGDFEVGAAKNKQ
jgi:hypothetical protein